MEARILQPLMWFGLLEHRSEVRGRTGRAASLPEDAAIRSLLEIRREAGYTPLTAAPSVILDRGDATTLPRADPCVGRAAGYFTTISPAMPFCRRGTDYFGRSARVDADDNPAIR